MVTSTNATFEFVKQLGVELAGNEFELPAFPDTAVRIREALNDPNLSLDTLSDIVLSEPQLTARLLRIANSAALRGASEITDLKAAISRTGLDMLQNIAVSFAAKEVFQAPAGSKLLERLDELRKHSIAVSVLAYVLGRKVKFSGKPDEAMLAGLLHAIGKFYILMRVEKFPELFADDEALNSLMAQWHTGVGRAIVESWGFPEKIATAVDEYELIEKDGFPMADVTDLVLVANLVALEGKTRDPEEEAEDQLEGLPSLSRMKINAARLRVILRESEEEIRSMTLAMSG